MAKVENNPDAAPQLTALNGMRFFAVFHIFLYHLWSMRFEMPRQKDGPMATAYANMEEFPHWLNNLLAHGYLSTSFFFLLSGFILAYLYWSPGGELSTTRQRFWWQRFTRIYPVHLIALLITILLTLPRWWIDPDAPPIPVAAASAVATATLTQAWFAPLVLADLGLVGGGVPLSPHAVADARAGAAVARASHAAADRNALHFADPDRGVPAVLPRRR